MIRKLLSAGTLAGMLLAPVLALGADTPAMQKLIAEAKKEGKVEVILGGQMPRRLPPAMRAFEKKYGIKVNYQKGSSRRHSARILAERKAGRFTADVWIGGANTGLSILLPNKMITPMDKLLIDPEVTNPKNWYQGKQHYTDPEGRYIFTWGASPAYVIMYNTNLVKPEEIKSYFDLFDPKWKGKIVSRDPSKRGSAASSIPMLINPNIGPKFFERFATELDVTIVSDSRQGAEWVALGRYAIGMFGLNTPAVDLVKQGFPVSAYLPTLLKEGEILSASAANMMAVDHPANPKAQQLFLNWALSKEGQSEFIKAGKTSDSLRVDVDSKLVDPQYRIHRDRDYYVAFSNKEYITQQRKLLKQMRKIMKKLPKKKKR